MGPEMMILSAAMSAVGAVMQGQQASASAEAQANAMRYSAQVQENNAKIARDQAAVREEQQRRHFGQLQGQAIAGAAQSGAGLSGSNADLLAQNEVMNTLDALTIRYEGQVGAQSHEAQAVQDRYAASVYDMNASNAQTAGFFNAGTNLLTGLTKYNYYGSGMSKGGGIGIF